MAQEFKKSLINGLSVNQRIGRASNVSIEEEIMHIATIHVYMVYNGFNRDLDAAMVYEWLIYSLE